MARKTVKRKSSKNVDLKQKLHDEGMASFSLYGFKGTCVADLVDAANCTKPMMYYYFGSKDEFYDALVAECIEAISPQRLAMCIKVDDLQFANAIGQVLDSVCKFAVANRTEICLLQRGDFLEPFEDFAKAIDANIQRLCGSAVAGKQLDEKKPKLLANQISTAIHNQAMISALGMSLGPDALVQDLIRRALQK